MYPSNASRPKSGQNYERHHGSFRRTRGALSSRADLGTRRIALGAEIVPTPVSLSGNAHSVAQAAARQVAITNIMNNPGPLNSLSSMSVRYRSTKFRVAASLGFEATIVMTIGCSKYQFSCSCPLSDHSLLRARRTGPLCYRTMAEGVKKAIRYFFNKESAQVSSVTAPRELARTVYSYVNSSTSTSQGPPRLHFLLEIK